LPKRVDKFNMRKKVLILLLCLTIVISVISYYYAHIFSFKDTYKYNFSVKDFIPKLIRVLRFGDIDRKRLAADFLGDIGPDAKKAVPVLKKTLKDK